jgi:hypothetical protein
MFNKLGRVILCSSRRNFIHSTTPQTKWTTNVTKRLSLTMSHLRHLKASLYFRREGQKKVKRINKREKSTSDQIVDRPVCSKNYRKIHYLLLEGSQISANQKTALMIRLWRQNCRTDNPIKITVLLIPETQIIIKILLLRWKLFRNLLRRRMYYVFDL